METSNDLQPVGSIATPEAATPYYRTQIREVDAADTTRPAQWLKVVCKSVGLPVAEFLYAPSFIAQAMHFADALLDDDRFAVSIEVVY